MDFIPSQDCAWWSDYDGVFQAPTLRKTLLDEHQNALEVMSRKAGFACIITNSNPAEVEKTIHNDVLNAGLVLIGEHGSVAKFDPRAGYETHPDLTIDLSVLPGLSRRAKEILDERNMPWTEAGEDLHKGEKILKVEQKQASFALVRAISGFNGNARALIDDMNKMTEDVMTQLSEEFGLTSSGWAHNKGADAQEFAQDGFSKQNGIEWARKRCELEGKMHVMHEDGNDSFLQWLHQTHDAFNIAVGDGLDHSKDHIFTQVEGIDDFWDLQQAMAEDMRGRGGVSLGTVSDFCVSNRQQWPARAAR